jgi:alkylation response protein AidB-like acyl-CoA dehydrogenase
VDFEESLEQKLLRDAVAKQVAAYGHEYYVGKARADQRATELWDDLGRNGYLGVNIPEAYGGGGMGISELAIVAEELAAQGCPLLLIVVSPAICATIIGQFGNEAQKEQWLPRLATGELKMAFAITEPDAGSSPPLPRGRVTSTASGAASTTSPASTRPRRSWW